MDDMLPYTPPASPTLAPRSVSTPARRLLAGVGAAKHASAATLPTPPPSPARYSLVSIAADNVSCGLLSLPWEVVQDFVLPHLELSDLRALAAVCRQVSSGFSVCSKDDLGTAAKNRKKQDWG